MYLHSQLRNANNAEKSTVVINAFLDIKPIIADRNAKHANDKPNGINTWATRTKPEDHLNEKILSKENQFLLGASFFHNVQVKSLELVE